VIPLYPVSVTDARANVTLLNDNTAVPGTAAFMGGAAYTQAGSAYVCLYPAGGLAPQGVTFLGGRAHRVDGARIVDTGGATMTVVGGIAITSTGAARVNSAAGIETAHNGISMTQTGVVCETGA
jgi:hypothetical protein